MRLAVLCTFIALSSGCSFLFVEGPPAPRERVGIANCTTSQLAPVVDTLLAAADLVGTGFAFSESGNTTYYGRPVSHGTNVTLSVTSLAVHASSAVYGFIRTADCREALGVRERRSTPAPPSWNLGPPSAQRTSAGRAAEDDE